MDSRDSSIDEARPLNPNGDRSDPPASITPPQNEYSDHAGNRQLAFPLIPMMRCLTIIFTFANILTQLLSGPRKSTETFLAVWDFFILFGSLVSLIIESREIKSRLPSIGLALGSRTYYLAGGPQDLRKYTFIADLDDHMSASRRRPLARVLSFVCDINLVMFLFIFSMVSVCDQGNYYSRYYHHKSTDAIFVMHFMVVAFMFIIIVARAVGARTGATVSLKLSLDENEKSGVHLPDEHVPRGV